MHVQIKTMTQLEEEHIFENFKNLYNFLPKGNASFEDKPDVIFTTETGETIGIEITESYYDQKKKSSSEFSIKFNNEVIEFIQEDFDFTFILDIELDNKFPIKTKFRDSLIQEIKVICKKEFSKLQNQQTIRLENIGDIDNFDDEIKKLIFKSGYRNFHKSIGSITMTRFSDLKKSLHLESNAGALPDFNETILNNIIETKSKRFSNYKKCDQNWLLISEGMDFYSYFGEIQIKNVINSKFDKIFLLRRFQSRVIELK